jgi:phosphohistidine phosphatase
MPKLKKPKPGCSGLLFDLFSIPMNPKHMGGIPMELVLMRHGKAETRSDAKADFDRELTSIGRKKVKQAARGLAHCLFPGRDILIWTSPSLRTVQTAEILREAFGKKAKLQIKDAIADGNLTELQLEWARTPSLDVLVVVGHEPMISDWTEKMSDSALGFRPASAASILFETSDRLTGSLAWFMRAGVMARLCPMLSPQRHQRS